MKPDKTDLWKKWAVYPHADGSWLMTEEDFLAALSEADGEHVEILQEAWLRPKWRSQMPNDQDLEKAEVAMRQIKKRAYLGKLRSYSMYLPPNVHDEYFKMLAFMAEAEVERKESEK